MAAEYKVLKIDELTRVSDAGGIEHYYRHTIKTKGGDRPYRRYLGEGLYRGEGSSDPG